MPGIMDILVRAQDMASDVLDNVGGAGERAAGLVNDNWLKATAVMVTAGTAIEGLARSQQEMSVETDQLAARLGEQSDTVRTWATEISNAGLPLEDAVGLMDLASKRGIEGKDALQQYAGFWDDVGDASGESAQQLAEAGVGLGQIGIAAGNESDSLAALGYVIDNTSGGVGDFLGLVNKMGPDLNDMGLDINDTAALLGVMENELGLTGKVAKTQFAEAVKSSGGDLQKMLDTLGITADQFDEYKTKVEESSGVVERNAAIEDSHHTVLEQVGSAIGDLLYQNAGLIQGLSTVAPILMAAGPVAGILSAGYTALTGATGLLSTATGALSGAMAFLAANPIVLVIAAIAALVAGLIWLWNNSEEFRDIVTAVFSTVAEVIGGVVDFVMGVIGGLVDMIVGAWNTITGAIQAALDFISGIINAVLSFIGELIAGFVGSYIEGFRVGFDIIRSVVQVAFDVISSVVSTVMGVIKAVIEGALAVIRGIFDAVFGAIRGVVEGAMAGIQSVISTVTGIVTGIFQAFAAGISAVWSGITGTISGAVNFITSLFDKVVGGVRTVMNFFGQAKDAIIGFVQGILDGITAPFRAIGDMLNSINPFAKHSPSLVENVMAGVRIIKDQYAGLGSIELSGPSFVSPEGAAAGGSAVTGGTTVIHNHLHVEGLIQATDEGSAINALQRLAAVS
jgi:phage-related protein